MKNTKHHRKPRSLGGTNFQDNISHVPQDQHTAWHNLFGNMSATQIASQLGVLFDGYVFIAVPKTSITSIAISTNYNVARHRVMQDRAIIILWGSFNMKRIVENINNRWIDTDFKIIHFKKIEK